MTSPEPIPFVQRAMPGSDRNRRALAQNTYFDAKFNRDAVKLLPGEFYFCSQDQVLVTVLGAGIAVCLRDTVTGIGGMNHFLALPPGQDRDKRAARSTMLYGADAMASLIDHLLQAGARLDQLEAKVFGGAQLPHAGAAADASRRSSDFALDTLSKAGIPLHAQALGGTLARKLYFFPYTGSVLVRNLVDLKNDTVQKRDRDYAAFIKPKLK